MAMLCGFRQLWLLLFLLFGCQSSLKVGVEKESEVLKTGTKLMPHQQKVLDYLAEHPDQKGLLINHYMGTGKTFLALAYGEMHPNEEIIILGPSYLKNNWKNEKTKFPVNNSSRYVFLSFDEALITEKSFDNKILIIDEAHNLVRLINDSDEKVSQQYAELYRKCQQAKKILALTGTPIYEDISDIAFLLNLVAGKELVTTNREHFRVAYSDKIKTRSFLRGYLLESNVLYLTMPVFFAFLSFSMLATPLAIIPGAAIGASIIPLLNQVVMPLPTFRLREGAFRELVPHLKKYVSYFRFKNPSERDFPKATVIERKVTLNPEQLDFLLRFIEEDLSENEIALLLKEHRGAIDQKTLSLRSTRIQKDQKTMPGAGREIGNLTHSETAYPPKFERMLLDIQNAKGKVAIFSHYFENGTKRFFEFLKTHHLAHKAVLVSLRDSQKIQSQKISQYNSDEKSIILFNFTEGVSLFKTRQLHVMEPPLNEAALEQIKGRAVRYLSHADLPASERQVDIFLWQATMPSWSKKAYDLKRNNWKLRYGELSEHSNWGAGRAQIDRNYLEKLYTPDEKAWLSMEYLKAQSQTLVETMTRNSIEGPF